MRDAVTTDNLVVFTSCLHCDLTVVGCECSFPKPLVLLEQTRYSLPVSFIGVTTMNDPNGPAVSVRFRTST